MSFYGFYWTLRRDIGVIGQKIGKIETHFSVPKDLSWELDVQATVNRTRSLHWALWVGLVAASVGAALVLGR